MAEITLNTKILLRYDTYENWTTQNPVLNAGEMAVTSIPTGSVEQVTPPAIMAKVGNGTSTYTELPWMSGLAADVYSWAKQATIGDTLQIESSGLGNVVTDVSISGNTITYTKGLTALTEQQSIKTLDTTSAVALETNASEAIAGDGTVQLHKVSKTGTYSDLIGLPTLGTAAAKDVDYFATAAQGALADTAVQSVTLASGTNNGTLKLTVDGSATDNIAVTGLGTAAYQEDTYFATAESVTTLTGRVSQNESDIDALQSQIGGLTGAMHFIGVSSTDPSTGTATVPDHDTFYAGDVCLYGQKEYVFTGTQWVELGDEGSYLTKTEASTTYVTQTTTVNGQALSGNITLTAADVGAATSADITSAINALDVDDTAVENSFVTSVSETDGKISVTRSAIQSATDSLAGITKLYNTTGSNTDGAITQNAATEAINALQTSLSKTFAANTGLTVNDSEGTVTYGIDTAVTFIFNCGGAAE